MRKGQGSIFRVKVGEQWYWRGQVQAGHYPSGKRRYVTVTRRTQREVKAEMDALRRRAGAGVVGRDQTVTELLDEWIDVKAPSLAPKTLREYRRRRDAIDAEIGRKQLRKLRARDVRDMMRSFAAKGVAPNTQNHNKSTLSSALAWAVDEQRIERNVAGNVGGAKVGPKLDDGLDKAEADAVLAAARDDRLYALLYLSLTLGLRQGEALNLRWADVDLEAGEIRVDQSKTRAGERSLPLVASTHDAMREHRKRQAQDRLEAGPRWRDHDLVFCEADGTPITPRDLTRWWHAVQSRGGVERRRWHALRHSAAGRMLDAGVPMELVSVVLGHAGIALTADVYARWSKDAKRRELGKYLGDDATG